MQHGFIVRKTHTIKTVPKKKKIIIKISTRTLDNSRFTDTHKEKGYNFFLIY